MPIHSFVNLLFPKFNWIGFFIIILFHFQMFLLWFFAISAIIVHTFAALSPKDEAQGIIPRQQMANELAQPLQGKKELGSVDQWLFDEPTNEDIGTVVSTMAHFLAKMRTDFVLDKENEPKIFAGIGQMLRTAQQKKTLDRMAAERTVKGHGTMEQLWHKVDKVKSENPFLAKTLAIWAERMPFLADRLLHKKVGTKNCSFLVETMLKVCEYLSDGQKAFPFPSSWRAFCEELRKLEKKERAQLEEELAREHTTGEEMWTKCSSPNVEQTSPKSEAKQLRVQLELPVKFQGIATVPSLDLNASRLMNKRLSKKSEQKMPKLGTKEKLSKLNVPILDLNAAQSSMKRLKEAKMSDFEDERGKRKE